jgi:hypothetical protein
VAILGGPFTVTRAPNRRQWLNTRGMVPDTTGGISNRAPLPARAYKAAREAAVVRLV